MNRTSVTTSTEILRILLDFEKRFAVTQASVEVLQAFQPHLKPLSLSPEKECQR